MDDVRALLDRAAAGLEPTPPTVTELDERRRSQVRTRAAMIIAAVCVAAVAVGVAVAVRPRATNAPASAHLRAAPLLSSVSPTALHTYRWRATPVAPIAPRDGAATVWTGNKMFVWGGTTGRQEFADGALYDPATRSWTMLPPAPLSARSYATAVLVGRTVVVWGGSGRTDGARYDLDAARWEPMAAPPAARARSTSFTSAFIGSRDRAILFLPASAKASATLEVAAYDAAANRWATLPSIDGPRNHDVVRLAALVAGSDVYAWPSWSRTTKLSARSSETSYGTDAYLLGSGTRRWVRTTVAPDRGSSATGAQPASGRVLFPQADGFCGGCTGPMRLSIQSVVVDTSGARRRVANGPLGAGGDHLFWVGSGALGYNSGFRISGPAMSTSPGDLAFWDSGSGAWTRLPSAPISDQLSEGNMLWTGERFIVWGLTTPSGTRAATGGVEFAPG